MSYVHVSATLIQTNNQKYQNISHMYIKLRISANTDQTSHIHNTPLVLHIGPIENFKYLGFCGIDSIFML